MSATEQKKAEFMGARKVGSEIKQLNQTPCCTVHIHVPHYTLCSRPCTECSLSHSQQPPSSLLQAHPLPWRGSHLPVDAGDHRLKCTLSKMVSIHVHRHCLQKAAKTNIPTIHQSASLPKNLMLICPCTFLLCFYFLFQIRTLKHLIIITSFTDMLLNQ